MFDKGVLGDGGFFWFIGKVESRQDPLATGRVQVRVFGTHSASLTDIPADDLPWAQVILPTCASPALDLRENDLVFGFWSDDYNKQIPVIVGKLAGYVTQPNTQGQGFNDLRPATVLQNAPRHPISITYNTDGSGVTLKNPSSASVYPLSQDLNKPNLSGATRYDIANTVIQQRINNLDKNIVTATGLSWSEPIPAFNPLYPYNKAYESESGHIIEYDDTPGYERITFTHRVGSFIDFYPSGSRVDKITKSRYSVVMADDYLHIMGRVLITVAEGAYIKVLGDVNIEADNNLNITANGNFNLKVGGNYNIVAKSLNSNILGDATLVTKGSQFMTSGDQFECSASQVDIQADTVNIEEGAGQGLPNSLSAPTALGTPNQGSAGFEPTPIPWQQNFQFLNTYTATAVKQSSFLDHQGNAPDANVANSACGFDVNIHTFLSSDAWAMSEDGLLQLQQREGYGKALANGSCQAYPDPILGASLLTIGFGCTNAVLSGADEIKIGTVWSRDKASQELLNAINNIFLPYLKQVVSVDLTSNMVDALLSFMFNVGTHNFAGSSVLRFTNQQNFCSAGASFLLWNRSGGQVVQGLEDRRQSEKGQYLT